MTTDLIFKNKMILFTGFRDEKLERRLQSSNLKGVVVNHFSNRVSFVVTKDKNTVSEKTIKALEKGIRVITKEELCKMLNIKCW